MPLTTTEREVEEFCDAFTVMWPRWDWAREHPEEAADELVLGGRVRAAFLVALSGEGIAPFHGGGHAFWKY